MRSSGGRVGGVERGQRMKRAMKRQLSDTIREISHPSGWVTAFEFEGVEWILKSQGDLGDR